MWNVLQNGVTYQMIVQYVENAILLALIEDFVTLIENIVPI